METRFDLDGKEITPLTICLIGGGGFIGLHLCERLMAGTPHKVIVVDFSDEKIKNLFRECYSWINRIEFHKFGNKYDSSHLESLVKEADVTINFGAFCGPENNTKQPLNTICRSFVDAVPVVKFRSESKKRLIHFSSAEVYGRSIGSFLPKDDPLRLEIDFYMLKEDTSPCVFGPVAKQRWSYACANQLIERLIFGEAAENGLEFTIVRPFNWIGPNMDLIPNEVVPRVLAFYANNLFNGKKLRVFDGEQSQHTFIHIDDAIDAILLMIENPSRANGQIFNVGNPNNAVTRKQLVEMMKKIYAKVSGESSSDPSTLDDNSNDDKIGKYIPDMAIINRQLGWNPQTTLPDLLEVTLMFQLFLHPLQMDLEDATLSSLDAHLL